MTQVQSYRDLLVWQRSMAAAEAVYRLTKSWPSDERYGLTSQARRASVSIAANIAEGAGRRTTGEFLQHLGIAKGSLCETETLLMLTVRLDYASEDHASVVMEQLAEVGRLLSGLIESLKTRQRTSTAKPSRQLTTDHLTTGH